MIVLPQPSSVAPQSVAAQSAVVLGMQSVVEVVLLEVVVVVLQVPWSQTSPVVQAETQALLTQVRHAVVLQPPQLSMPPQPSETVPQVPAAHDVAGVQQAPLKTSAPGAQQTPNRAAPCLTVAFAQFRLQQLTLV